MVYQLLTVPTSRQALKKLPLDVRKRLLEALEVLQENPRYGQQLEPPWQAFRSFHTKYQNTQYRVIYEVDDKKQLILLRFAGPRENFYKKVRQLKLKPLL